MHYDGNRGASINLLKVNLLQEDVIIRYFFSAYFLDNYMTRTAKKKSLVTYPRLSFKSLYIWFTPSDATKIVQFG